MADISTAEEIEATLADCRANVCDKQGAWGEMTHGDKGTDSARGMKGSPVLSPHYPRFTLDDDDAAATQISLTRGQAFISQTPRVISTIADIGRGNNSSPICFSIFAQRRRRWRLHERAVWPGLLRTASRAPRDVIE